MKSTLPSRWQEILRREAAEHVGKVLAQAKEQPDPRHVPRWTVPALAVGVASVSLLSMNRATGDASKGSVPFDRSTVISTRSAGLGASAEDLAPRPTPSSAPPAIAAAPATEPDLRPARPSPRPAGRVREPRHECRDCDKRRATMAHPVTLPTPDPEQPPPPAPEKPRPLVINIGTRIAAVLTDPVVTGAALAPATAKLSNDVHVGDRLAIPAGTLLVGEGFATQQDDRAQVVFTAMIRDGKTVPFEGWALQEGQVGIRGKVVRKGSKTRKGAGAILGAAASALTFGVAGALPGPEGAALASLGNTASNDLVGLSREWRHSDKVVRIAAGVSITVYIRRDLTME